MNKSFDQLWDEYETLTQNNVSDIIDFYEANSKSISKIDINKSEEHYHGKLRFEMQYGLNLVDKGMYSKGSEILKNAIPMYEFAPDINSDNFENDTVFERLLWSYGVALYEIGNIKEAIKSFNKLVYFYPENDKYKKWFTQLKTQKLSKITSWIWAICAFWLLGSVLKLDSKFNLGFIYTIIGIVILLLGIGLEIFKILVKRGMVEITPHNKK